MAIEEPPAGSTDDDAHQGYGDGVYAQPVEQASPEVPWCACHIQREGTFRLLAFHRCSNIINQAHWVHVKCRATIGQVGNVDHELVSLGKAGKARYLGLRPEVRGSVMNPVDHPHGGGEGKSPIGHAGPLTPWGKPALGYKTRKKKNATNKFILKRIN